LRARKYKLKQVDAIHETENALLPGKEVSKNKWQIVYLDSPGIEKPTIKLRYANKTKNFLKRFRWDELKRDRKGYLLVTKKQLKAD
jgi:GTPase Era involved in 16S rRNA processing